MTSHLAKKYTNRVFVFFSLICISLAIQAQPLTENQHVPNISFKDIKGNTHQLSEYRGKWLFLNFWAGYCPICKKEAPTLVRFQQTNKNKVTLLGINYGGETRQKIKEAMKRNKYNYLIIPDQRSITQIFSDVVGTPTTIIISPQGRFIKKAIGRQSYEELSAYFGVYQESENESENESESERTRIWDN